MPSLQRDELVRQALEKVLESPGFAQSPQLSNFLDYVVRKSLAGEAHELKGYTIGVEALGRREDFDPQTDTAVRVLAGRLRKALDNYNREVGDKQQVHITIPTGSYVPVFNFFDDAANDSGKYATEQTAGETPADHALATPTAVRSNGRTFLLAIAGLLLAVVVIGYGARYVKDHDHEPAQDTLTFEESHLPSISVSVRAADDHMPDWFSQEEATAGTIVAFSKFKDFRIYKVENALQPVGTEDSPADYHFSAIVSRAGTSDDLYVSTTLTRQADRTIIWSGNKLLDERDDAVGIDALNFAGEIIGPLLSPFGVVNGNIASWEALPPRLQCIKLFNAYFSGKDTHTKALQCAQAAVRSGTAPSSMHAMLAYLYIEAYQKQIPDVGEDPLAMAGKAARNAIELDSQNARAHHAMFAVHMTRGHPKKALKSASKALTLNPFDSAIAGTFARYLVLIGKLKDAGPALAKAFSLNPSRPARLEIFAYLQADLSGNFAEADQLAASITPDTWPLAAMAVALYGLRNGDSAKTQRALNALARMDPDFMADPATALLRRGFDPGIAETIAARLVTVSPDIESNTLRLASQIPTGPKIAIMPIQELNSGPELSELSRGLTIQLAHDLEKFKHLYIISSNTSLKMDEQDLRDMTAQLDYIIQGSSVRRNHSIQLVMQMLQAGDDRVVWSQTYDRELTAGTLSDVLNEISADIAVQLGTPYGLVHELETRRTGFDSDLPLSDYACSLHFYDYLSSKSPASHLRQRNCLRIVTKKYPQFARAWSMLSWIYGDEIRYKYNLSSVQQAKDNALQAALEGVRLDTGDFFTHQYLAETYSLRGQHELAGKSLERALQLNSNDPDLLASAGRQLVYSGDWKTGILLADKAIKLNPEHPPWYRIVPFLNHYRKGEYQQALVETEMHAFGEMPTAVLARTVTLQKLGRHREAAKLKRVLLRELGAFVDKPAKNMQRMLIPAAVAKDIVNTLKSIVIDDAAERD